MDRPSFEEWREYCFTLAFYDFCGTADQSEDGDARIARFSGLPSALELSYVTRLFETASEVRERHSRSEVDNGLHYIVSASCSGCLAGITDQSIPWPDRERSIIAMKPLYRDLMAPVYGDMLGHLETSEETAPNFASYMWWDVIGIYGGMDHPEIDRINDAVFEVLTYALTLRSEACNESALHGLGHWHPYVPGRSRSIVLEALSQRTDWSPELREYALQASQGMVQ